MTIFPAIDLYEGQAVRLIRGDYAQMTVYSNDPVSVARGFKADGATHLHVVDLEGARDGQPKNLDVIERIIKETGLCVEVGGGIRTAETVERYIAIGVFRVILGTAAVLDPAFVSGLVRKYGSAVAVSVDIRDGLVAIKGWTELSGQTVFEFCKAVQGQGIKTIICTDISKDGLLGGTNMELYRDLRQKLRLNIIASGGITAADEVAALKRLGMYGAILGKAIYTGDLLLIDALSAAKGE